MAEAGKEKEKDKAPAATEGGAPAGAEGTESPEKTKKKRKLLIIGGIAGLALLVLGIAGLFVTKTLMAPKVEQAAKNHSANPAEGENKGDHGTAKSEKKDEHGKASEEKPKDEKHEAESAKDKEHGDKSKEGNSAEGKDSKAAPGADEKDTKERTTEFGEAYEFPKMDLNIGNPLENRYLRIGMSIEYHGGEKQKEDIKKREPLLKDIVISAVSNKSRIDLLTEKGKEKLRRELTNRFNEVLERPIKAIYFTDFLVE